jgi:ArsR family transcriptional regulator
VKTRPDDLLFRAFADERRLRILHLLRAGEMCVADLVQILDLPQSTVSRQLGILREAGLIGYREEGPWRHYALVPPAGPLHEHLVECLGRCFAHVPELQDDARRATEVTAAGGCCPAAGQALGGTTSTCSLGEPGTPPTVRK